MDKGPLVVRDFWVSKEKGSSYFILWLLPGTKRLLLCFVYKHACTGVKLRMSLSSQAGIGLQIEVAGVLQTLRLLQNSGDRNSSGDDVMIVCFTVAWCCGGFVDAIEMH